MSDKDFKQGRRGGGDVHILELKKEIYKIIKTSLEENPDGSVSYNWIVNLDRFTEIFFKRLEALEKKLNKAILHWSNYGDMADLIRNDNAKRISELEEKLKNK